EVEAVTVAVPLLPESTPTVEIDASVPSVIDLNVGDVLDIPLTVTSANVNKSIAIDYLINGVSVTETAITNVTDVDGYVTYTAPFDAVTNTAQVQFFEIETDGAVSFDISQRKNLIGDEVSTTAGDYKDYFVIFYGSILTRENIARVTRINRSSITSNRSIYDIFDLLPGRYTIAYLPQYIAADNSDAAPLFSEIESGSYNVSIACSNTPCQLTELSYQLLFSIEKSSDRDSIGIQGGGNILRPIYDADRTFKFVETKGAYVLKDSDIGQGQTLDVVMDEIVPAGLRTTTVQQYTLNVGPAPTEGCLIPVVETLYPQAGDVIYESHQHAPVQFRVESETGIQSVVWLNAPAPAAEPYEYQNGHYPVTFDGVYYHLTNDAYDHLRTINTVELEVTNNCGQSTTHSIPVNTADSASPVFTFAGSAPTEIVNGGFGVFDMQIDYPAGLLREVVATLE
ncbi:MAG: hypothetical protein MJE68_00185, partial [Proteobacteria bacterium]|nr:hypothetical protein [Pseudomonadota bacterium]